MTKIPRFDELMNPTLQALRNLGGSGTIEEIYLEVSDIMGLTDEQLDFLHNPEKSSQTKVEYRLAWARTYLKKYGLMDNSSRGVWTLTPEGKSVGRINPTEVKKYVRDQDKAEREQREYDEFEDVDDGDDILESWREELIACLLNMAPDAFERLIQRMLRESGFSQVEVTGRTGDGGIDGKGIMQIGGLLSFNVIFQCKRYKGSVGSREIRDFRGAMIGRADKALFVTTGNFTKDATRDGAPTIDLIDGDRLIDKLKELALGVTVKKVEVEDISIETSWFESI